MSIYDIFLLLSVFSLVLLIILLIAIKNKKKFWYVYLLLSLSFLVFGSLKIYSIIAYVIKNRNEIITKSLSATSDVLSKGLTLTASNFEKNWDKQIIDELKDVKIEIKSVKYENTDKGKKCILEIIVINNVSNDQRKIYMHDLLENNYLVAYDNDDFVHTIDIKEYENDKIPFGKSKGIFETNIDKDSLIKGISFLNNKIEIKE
jgi:hypothetical protein